jgi:hypothetical protein
LVMWCETIHKDYNGLETAYKSGYVTTGNDQYCGEFLAAHRR